MVNSHQIAQRARMLGFGIIAVLATVPGASSAAAAAAPPPSFGQTVDLIPTGGRVTVTVPGGRAATLTAETSVPVGSLIHASRGGVVIVSASPSGPSTYSADVTGDPFTVVQPRSGRGVTELELSSTNLSGCSNARTAKVWRGGTLKTKAPSGYKPHAAADAVGTFRTVGQFQAAANVGAATWTITDTCSSTSVDDHAGSVNAQTSQVTSYHQSLTPNRTWMVACSRSGQPPVARGYCVTLFAEKFPGGWDYLTNLLAKTTADRFDLCTTAPATATTCRTWAFYAPAPDTSRNGTVICPAMRAGKYTFRWRIAGVPLPVTLPALHVPRSSSSHQRCIGDIGAPVYLGPEDLPSAPLRVDAKNVNRYVLPTDGWVDSVDLYVATAVAEGLNVGTLQGIVYNDMNGSPGNLIAASDLIRVTSDDPAEVRHLQFEPDVNLAAGTYWIGVIQRGSPDLVTVHYRHGTSLDTSTSPLSGLAGDPFGPFTVSDERLWLEADYSLDPPQQ